MIEQIIVLNEKRNFRILIYFLPTLVNDLRSHFLKSPPKAVIRLNMIKFILFFEDLFLRNYEEIMLDKNYVYDLLESVTKLISIA